MGKATNDIRAVILASLTSVAIVLTVSAFAVAGAAPEAGPIQSQRVLAPEPEPVEPIPVAAEPSPVCPQMNNPGGRMQWVPSQNPGPIPMDANVVIPSIGVDAPIVQVGIDSGYKMVVPSNARDIAWLDQGGIPGVTQNIVLAGHISYNRVAGSFNQISRMQAGDLVEVFIDGEKRTYQVKWNCAFPFDTDRAAQIMGYTQTESLTLITCGGVFDRAARTHNQRIVVRAERVDGGFEV
jgi:LPXTG-site transpeptidase (sortase) family protein